MNRPILCCLKIKQATLFVGVIDLILHMMVLTTLFALYSHPNLFDHYYANSLSLIVSPSSSFYSTSLKNEINDFNSPGSIISKDLTTSTIAGILSKSTNSQLNQQFKNQQLGQIKFRQYDSDSFGSVSSYQNVNMSRDKSIAFLVTSFSSFLTMMLIYGIIKNKPSYLMPYFSIKVFQVVMGCLTTLGFYSCLPNVRLWIETHHFFPMKKELLLLENQTLELFVFSILLTSILVKLYVVIIVWYCYRYMVTIKSFIHMGDSSAGIIGNNPNGANMGGFNESSFGFKIDDESLISQPPKYEEIIKQIKQESNINNNNINVPTTSSNIIDSSNDVIIPLRDQPSSLNEIPSQQNNQPPSYGSAVLNKSNNKSNINEHLVI